jgi:hypothetical protein
MKEWKFTAAILVLALVSPLGFSAPNSNITPDSHADLDGDLFVTSQDISKLASCIGQDPHINRACKPADVDKDSDIDIDDYRFVSARLGQSYPGVLYPMPASNAGGSGLLFPQQIYYWSDYVLDFKVSDVNSDGLADMVTLSERGVSIGSYVGNDIFQEKYIAIDGWHDSIALGDVNGDDKVDLIMSTQLISDNFSNVIVYLGNGDGSFEDPQDTTLHDVYYATLTLDDMNSDGKLDLVAKFKFDNYILVSLGNGDGSFQPQQRFSTGEEPASMSLRDMNGDSLLDVVVANRNDDDISILLGSDDGTLLAQQRFSTGRSPGSMSVVDMNGDDLLDVVVANQADDDISVLLGNGDGSLQAQQRFSTGTFPTSMSVVDMNGDGLLDVVVANQADDDISVLLGNGDGNLQTQQRFPVGGTPTSITLGDVNRDSAIDIGIGIDSGGISVLYGHGDGSFREYQIAITEYRGVSSVSLDDLNGGGLLDFYFRNSSGVSVRFGDGEGGFSSQQQVNAGGKLVEMADFNGDNFADAVTVNANHLSILLGKGDGSFQPQSQTYKIDRLVDIVDMNGNGRLDVVAIVAGRLSIFLGKGDGDFQKPVQSDSDIDFKQISQGDMSLGDMNGDGILDAVVADNRLLVLLTGEVDGTFQEQRRHLLEYYCPLAGLGDINGDGMLDAVVTIGFNLEFLVLLGSTDIASQDLTYAGSFEEDPSRFIFNDLNGDGRDDLIFTDHCHGHGGCTNVLLGGDDGVLRWSSTLDMELGSEEATALGDLNRDGHLDLVNDFFIVDSSVYIIILLGNGNGHFIEKYGLGVSPYSLNLADLNGDELLDMVAFFSNGGGMMVLLGNGDGSFQRQQYFQIDNQADSVFLTDVNGDDRLDVVFSHGEDFTVMLNQSSF